MPGVVEKLPLVKGGALCLFAEARPVHVDLGFPVPDFEVLVALHDAVNRSRNSHTRGYEFRGNPLDSNHMRPLEEFSFQSVTEDSVTLKHQLLEPFDRPRLLRLIEFM